MWNSPLTAHIFNYNCDKDNIFSVSTLFDLLAIWSKFPCPVLSLFIFPSSCSHLSTNLARASSLNFVTMYRHSVLVSE